MTINGALRIHDKADIVVAFNDLAAIYGMRQKQLAAASGYFPSQLSEWMRGKKSMDVTSMIRLANALGYDLALIPREDA